LWSSRWSYSWSERSWRPSWSWSERSLSARWSWFERSLSVRWSPLELRLWLSLRSRRVPRRNRCRCLPGHSPGFGHSCRPRFRSRRTVSRPNASRVNSHGSRHRTEGPARCQQLLTQPRTPQPLRGQSKPRRTGHASSPVKTVTGAGSPFLWAQRPILGANAAYPSPALRGLP
jgi:hypothetical protein